MYFLRTSKAIDELRRNAISERESLKYMIGLAIFAGLGVPTFISQAPEDFLWILELATFAIGVAFFIVALRRTYALNAPTDTPFLPRFLTLNFIVSIQALLITCVPYIVLMVICEATTLIWIRGTESPVPGMLFGLFSEMIIDFIFEAGGVVLWFWLIMRSFRRLTEQQGCQHNPGA